MLDRLGTNPEYLASGCLTWVAVAVMIVSLVHWMIMGEIDGLSGVLGITVAFLLGFFAINPPEPMLAPLIMIAAFATLLLAPLTRAYMNRSALSAIEVEAIGRAYELLATKPDNFGAQVRLARSLYNKGIKAHAIAIAEKALANVPERLFPDEHRMLAQWKHAARDGDSPVRIRCFECGIPNFPGTLFCTQCGAPFLLDFAQGRWVKGSTVKRAVSGWMAAVAALVGVPMAAMSLPPIFAGAVILILLVFGVWMLLSAFREPSTGMK